MDFNKCFIEKMVYPYMEKHKGNQIRLFTNDLLNTQSLTPDQLLDKQKDKLQKLLLECIRNVPAYKGCLKAEEISADPFKALIKIPVLTKKEYMHDSSKYLNDKADQSKLIANLTGGSTSEPVKFYMDRYTVEHYEAARWRGLSWYGITQGSRSVMVWGNPLELNNAQNFKHYLEEKYLKNRIVIPAYDLNPDRVSMYLRKVMRYKPEYIYGYSSALYAFASLIKKQNLTFDLDLKAVVSTSETLFDFQRELIHEVFKCPVVGEYGARDAGILAYECPNGSYHISQENAVIEVLDPITHVPVADGENGVLAITDLNNYSMPRLRYILGDMASYSKETCSCGRGLKVLRELSGRVDDMFVTKDGHFVHGHIFNHIARNLSSIQQFQIRQKSTDQAELDYVKTENAKQEEVDFFIQEAQKVLPGCAFTIKEVKSIPLTKSGKFRYAIREFPLT